MQLRLREKIPVEFIAEYSPFLQPVEYIHAKLRKIVENKIYMNNDEYALAVINSVNKLTKKDFKNCYKHVLKECLAILINN